MADLAGLPALLYGLVFAASVMQAVTGIGFGVIAGPVLLVTMGSAGAVQVSIVLSFLIALLLAPSTWRQVNGGLLRALMLGVLLGTPLGALAFAALPLSALKLMAAVTVGAMTLIAAGLLSRYPVFERDTPLRRAGAGVLCGALNATLAMPGPPVAAYATAIRSAKETIRATTLATFLFAYPVAFLCQAALAGISPELLPVALPLAVPTLLGTLCGMLIAPRVNPGLFRWLTVAFLAGSVAMLLR